MAYLGAVRKEMIIKARIMKIVFIKVLQIALLSLIIANVRAQSQISIIPEPVLLQKKEGTFTLPQNVSIATEASGEAAYVWSYLKNKLVTSTGCSVNTVKPGSSAVISLDLLKKNDNRLGSEGYTLSVDSLHISIKANKAAGLFYGVQTLFQLFPKEIESPEKVANIRFSVPCVDITDYPKLGWRGLMFDVSRHFFTKTEVKQYIDAMVRYKYNLLHLHLADDEGWRIEIKSLPKLTEVGAWSVKKIGTFGYFTPPAPNEPRTYGGFYTQEDIKELISYAKERFVNILPEIDVPGHSLAAIASYPELSCTQGAENYKVRSGEQIMDWSRGAPPIALVDNTLCPANDKVYDFMEKVITEISALFPFEYIHLGGDEAPINFWQKSDAIKVLMQKEKLKNMHEVQGYFEKRIQSIVRAKGKKMIGWDEILEGGLSSDVAIMLWRNPARGIEASKKKHEVIMAPSMYAYLDYMQADKITEPPVYASLRLSQSYEFNPIPEGADPKHIKGGQANLWTEQVYNIRQAEYMTWPRAFAIAESIWSPVEKKNWPGFFAKVEEHFKRFDVSLTKYAPSVYDPIFEVQKSPEGKIMVGLSTEISGLDIYYSFDNSFPDRFYPKYTEKLIVPDDASMLRVITYRGNQPIGRMQHMPVDELKKRAGGKR